MPNLLPTTLIFIIWSGATALAALPFVLWSDTGKSQQLISIGLAPLIFVVAFSLIAGLLSLIGQSGIKRGKFPREALHPVYLLRRIYGACWTQLYYFKPVYSVVLAIPLLKKVVLRLFGYRGSCNFVCYPDTWIRDLPILKIGVGAYLSNRATIGTNICLSDGTILVDSVKVDQGGMVGHLSMLAPGAKIGEKTEIGVGCAIGIRVNIMAGTSIKPSCSINHGVKIGKNVDVGPRTFIGLRCEIGDAIKIPAGSNIPAGSILQNQSDVDLYYSSETEKLESHTDSISEIVKKHLRHVP